MPAPVKQTWRYVKTAGACYTGVHFRQKKICMTSTRGLNAGSTGMSIAHHTA